MSPFVAGHGSGKGVYAVDEVDQNRLLYLNEEELREQLIRTHHENTRLKFQLTESREEVRLVREQLDHVHREQQLVDSKLREAESYVAGSTRLPAWGRPSTSTALLTPVGRVTRLQRPQT